MTGFGSSRSNIDGAGYNIELRSVNARFFDLRLRLPWRDAVVEQRIGAHLKAIFSRGRFDLTVRADAEEEGLPLTVNRTLAGKVRTLLDELAALLGCERAEVLPLVQEVPGLIGAAPAARSTADKLWDALRAPLDEAVAQLKNMRETEGAALARDLSDNLNRLVEVATTIGKNTPARTETMRVRFEERIAQIIPDDTAVDPARVAQEIALLVERADVNEELTRIHSHASQLEETFGSTAALGRRCEFILQELSREFNTVAAKVADSDMTVLVIDAKSTLEKMREQVQNVE